MVTWPQINLINSASAMTKQLLFFHNHSMMIILMITSTVAYMTLSILCNKIMNRSLLEEQTIETIWTIISAIIIIFIVLPSLQLLYLIDEIENPLISIKSIGRQWFWTYKLPNFKNIEFDSYNKN